MGLHHDGPPACHKSHFGLEDRTDFYEFHTNEPTTRSNHELKWEIPAKGCNFSDTAIISSAAAPLAGFLRALPPFSLSLADGSTEIRRNAVRVRPRAATNRCDVPLC